MSLRDCLESVKKAAGGELSDQEAMDLLQKVDEIRQKAGERGDLAGAAARIRQDAADEAVRVKRAAALQRKHIALNAMRRQEAAAHVEAFTAKGYSVADAFQSLLIGSQKRVAGARKSIWAWRQAYEGRYMGPLMGRLTKEKPHFEKLLSGRDWLGRTTPEARRFDDDVAREMEQIGKADGTPGLTGNADAKWTAELLSELAERARRDLNSLGADIGKLDGWLPYTHFAERVRAVTRDLWVAFIKPKLDLDRTFPNATGKAIDEILQDIWGNIVSGMSNLPTAGEQGIRTGPANLAKSLGKERVLHFANTDAYLEYNRRFGYGTTAATTIQHLRTAAHKAGLMRTLGPNPELMFQSLTEGAARAQKDLDPTSKQIRTLRNATGWASWRVVSGQADIAVSERLAKGGLTVRQWQQLSKLMGAVLSALPTDPIMMANALRFQGKRIVPAYAQTFKGYFRGRGRGQEREIAFLLNEGYESLIDSLVTPHAIQEGETGWLARATRFGFRLQGLSGFTDVGRSVGARIMSADFGRLAAGGWDTLSARYRNVLELQGITPVKWEAARQAAWEGENGNRYLTPERIADLPDEVIGPLAADRLDALEMGLADRVQKRMDRDVKESAWVEKRVAKYQAKFVRARERLGERQERIATQAAETRQQIGDRATRLGERLSELAELADLTSTDRRTVGRREGRLQEKIDQVERLIKETQDDARLKAAGIADAFDEVWTAKDAAAAKLEQETIAKDGERAVPWLQKKAAELQERLFKAQQRVEERLQKVDADGKAAADRLDKRIAGYAGTLSDIDEFVRATSFDRRRIGRDEGDLNRRIKELDQDLRKRDAETDKAIKALGAEFETMWKAREDEVLAFVERMQDRSRERAEWIAEDKAMQPERIARVLEDTRRDLELDLRRMYADEIGFGIIETDDASKRWTTGGGLQRGTPGGEAARLLMQLKGFPIAFSQRVLGRRFKAAAGETRGQRILNSSLHLGELIATLTVAGLFATWSKDVARGKSPKDLITDDGDLNYKTMLAAFVQGGGAGIYGDFLFGEFNRFGRSPISTLGGPAVGDFEGLLQTLGQVKNGDPKASNAVNLVLGLTPFVNLWFLRLGLDYLIVNPLREWASPGSSRRAAKRAQDDFGQTTLLAGT